MISLVLLVSMPFQPPNFKTKKAQDIYDRVAPKISEIEYQTEKAIKERKPFNVGSARLDLAVKWGQKIDDLEKMTITQIAKGNHNLAEDLNRERQDWIQRKKDLALGFFDKQLKANYEKENEAGRVKGMELAEPYTKEVLKAIEREDLDIERFCELIATKFQAKQDLEESTKAYQEIEKKTQDRSALLVVYKKKKEANDLLEETNRELKKAAKGFFVIPSIEP